MRVLKALHLNVWIGARDFIERRARFVRPKDFKPDEIYAKPRRPPQRIIKQ